MMTRLRVILPPGWTLAAFAILYGLSEAPILLFVGPGGRPGGGMTAGVILSRVAAFSYGVFRVWSFHPAVQAEYRGWLERTPWRVGKPLPGGPIHLTWGDALVFGALVAAVAPRGSSQMLAVVSIGLIAHSVALATTLLRTGPKAAGLVVAFGAGLAVRLWPDRLACLAAAVGTQAAGWVGLRLALARFPWPDIPEPPKGEAAQATGCGWPYDQLKPTPPARMGRGLLVGTSLLAGWYFFAWEAVNADLGWPPHIPRLAFSQALFMMIVGRVAGYCQGYAPPVGLRGRLRTFRWVVPGYDQIFVAPLGIALIGTLAVDRFRPEFLTDEVALAAGLALALMVASTAGPDLTRWRLTGNHRIVPSNLTKTGHVKVG